MKKRILTSALLSLACVGFVSVNAFGYNYDPADYAEYETVVPSNATTSILPAVGTSSDIYIWANDENLVSWTIAWTGLSYDGDPATANRVDYGGEIILLNGEGDFEVFAWESNDSLSVYYNGSLQSDDVNNGETFIGDFGRFRANATNAYDYITVDFTGWEDPSYIAFDLSIGVLSPSQVANKVHIGSELLADLQNVADDDFKIHAPVPEPTTMLLFGVGLAGLAGISRRKNNKK